MIGIGNFTCYALYFVFDVLLSGNDVGAVGVMVCCIYHPYSFKGQSIEWYFLVLLRYLGVLIIVTNCRLENLFQSQQSVSLGGSTDNVGGDEATGLSLASGNGSGGGGGLPRGNSLEFSNVECEFCLGFSGEL